jgi:hypothetical protein
VRPAVAIAVLVARGDARADEGIRHVVKAGDSCSSIAQRYWGDARLVDRLHAANPDLARRPPPHVLAEGTVLVIVPAPPPSGAAPDAQLTAVSNEVDVLTPEAKRGKPNDPLFRGNRVSTHASSAADVTFRDETQVKLGERTLVVIFGDARSAAQKLAPSSEAELVTGNLRAFMPGAKPDAKKDAPARRDAVTSVAVGTPAATVRVHDGEAQVSADQVKTTRLAVYAGSSTIDARGKMHEVARGYGSKAELGRPPTAPRPLPPAPRWSTTPPLTLLDPSKAVIAGDYDVPDADRVAEFHVQIAHDGIFRSVVLDTKVPARVRRVEARPPGAGRYYIRVSAIDDDAFEGPFGPTARTIVLEAHQAALPDHRRRIAIEPPDAFCVRVGNVALTRIDGPFAAGMKEPVRVRCAPSESDPTTLFSLDPSAP